MRVSKWFPSLPASSERFAQAELLQRQQGEKSPVVSAVAVGGLPPGQEEDLFHQVQVEMEKERAVEEEAVSLPPLGVAGEFERSQRQIGVALDLDRLVQ